MDFKQLHYITAIAESQNITRAAENLFISRSALNYSLLNLEQEIGLPLFKRINNTMIPTAAGKVFLEHAYQILQISKDCRKNLEDMVDCARGTLRPCFPWYSRNSTKRIPNMTWIWWREM